MADHPIFAALYDRMTGPAEDAGMRQLRRELLSAARGRTLEVGAGTGHNLPHYPAAVTELVAVEPDGAMRRRLEAKLGQSPVPVTVVAAGVDDAELPAGGFDTIVATLALCTVPDPDAAARRFRTLLAPGGRVLFLEHVRAPGWRGVAQRAANPVWSHLAAGCRLDRDPVAALRRAGVTPTSYRRVTLPLGPGLSYGVVGQAHPTPALEAR